MSTVSNFSTVPLLDSEICYDRQTRDYAVYIAGELIGYAATYRDAELARTAVLARRAEAVAVVEEKTR